MNKLLVGTTFSGIGAPETALKELNISHTVKWACDINKHSKKTYDANHSCEKWYDDITKIDLNNLEYVDLYVFGFPCQAFSYAGKQKGVDDERGLLANYSLEIIKKIKPKFILFENVKGLLSKKFSDFFLHITKSIKENYNFDYVVLDSQNFGVPQHRERVFGIGIRNDLSNNLNQITHSLTHSQVNHVRISDILEVSVDQKYFINTERSEKIINTAFREQKNFQLQDKIGEVNSAGKTHLFGSHKIRYKGISFCLNLVDIHGVIYSDNKTIRKFTPREYARLQGFPDSFNIPVKDYLAYQQFGNTISVPVLKSIFSELLLTNHL